MAKISTFHLAHVPHNLLVHVALYKELRNAEFLRRQLLEGNQDFEYGFLDARMVLSTTQVLAAVFKAINDMESKRLKSHNVHSEIVFCMSPNNNIAESFRKFGISDRTQNLLVVKVSEQGAGVCSEHLNTVIEGQAVEFDDVSLSEMSDLAEIKKVYKIGTGPSKGKQSGAGGVIDTAREAKERQDIEVTVLGLMAIRGAT